MKVTKKTIVTFLTIIIFTSSYTSYVHANARDYVDNFQSMDFREMLENNNQKNVDGFSDQFNNKKSGVKGIFENKKDSSESGIGQSTINKNDLKSNLSKDNKKEESNISKQFKNKKSQSNSKHDKDVKSSKKEHDGKEDLKKKHSKTSKENAKITDGATPSGLTGYGNKLKRTPKGYGKLPSLKVTPEKRGQIYSSVKRLSSQYESLNQAPVNVEEVVGMIRNSTDNKADNITKHDSKSVHNYRRAIRQAFGEEKSKERKEETVDKWMADSGIDFESEAEKEHYEKVLKENYDALYMTHHDVYDVELEEE